MNKVRVEKDSLGEVHVPENALFGAQTQRAINNFPISRRTLPKPFIRALLMIKTAAVRANGELECLTDAQANAIEQACEQLLSEESLMDHFPVDVFQTGSGTSTNMNVNEVVATLASRLSGESIHPNNHVNYGQSSNDVIPSAIHVSSALQLHHHLLPALNHLLDVIELKASRLKKFCKTGRTHLMDAMPIRMDQALLGWAAQIRHDIHLLNNLRPSLHMLAQGGSAVGTGINVQPDFVPLFHKKLSDLTGVFFVPTDNYFAAIGSQDTIVALSGVLKTTAVSIMKIANDLRWMNSGPLAGLGEIFLEPLQPGSSIMPGKVNPVIPEAVAMACAQVIGNDTAISIGGQSGNFELNVMLPMIAYNILDSIELLGNSSRLLADKAIESFSINEQKLQEILYKNPILVTALNPLLGYDKAAEIAKRAYQEQRSVIDVAEEMTQYSKEELQELLNPEKLTYGGVV